MSFLYLLYVVIQEMRHWRKGEAWVGSWKVELNFRILDLVLIVALIIYAFW